MQIDHHRSLLDPASCQTFTEVIVTDKANRMKGTLLNDELIEMCEKIIATAKDAKQCSGTTEADDVQEGVPGQRFFPAFAN